MSSNCTAALGASACPEYMYDANVSMSAFTKVMVNATDSYVSDYFTTNNDTE